MMVSNVEKNKHLYSVIILRKSLQKVTVKQGNFTFKCVAGQNEQNVPANSNKWTFGDLWNFLSHTFMCMSMQDTPTGAHRWELSSVILNLQLSAHTPSSWHHHRTHSPPSPSSGTLSLWCFQPLIYSLEHNCSLLLYSVSFISSAKP